MLTNFLSRAKNNFVYIEVWRDYLTFYSFSTLKQPLFNSCKDIKNEGEFYINKGYTLLFTMQIERKSI